MTLACPILRGALAGLRWQVNGKGKIARVLLGTYEPEQTRRFAELLKPGMRVLDVGAHVGYYTLLSARLVGAAGRVAAFEPSPANLRVLRHHVSLNRLGNVTIVDAAVAGAEGTARFDLAHGSGTGQLAGDGGLEVRTVTLDAWCERQTFVPDLIKLDIEGAEASALPAAATILAARPPIFLSTHGVDVEARCKAFLASLGYGFTTLYGADGDAAREFLCEVQ
jgi:FkbM family methyltransferase